jgi:hypothetical protein
LLLLAAHADPLLPSKHPKLTWHADKQAKSGSSSSGAWKFEPAQMTALHLLLGDSCSLFLGPAAASSYEQLLPACLQAALSVQRFEQGLKRQLVPVADVLNSSSTFNSAGEAAAIVFECCAASSVEWHTAPHMKSMWLFDGWRQQKGRQQSAGKIAAFLSGAVSRTWIGSWITVADVLNGSSRTCNSAGELLQGAVDAAAAGRCL